MHAAQSTISVPFRAWQNTRKGPQCLYYFGIVQLDHGQLGQDQWLICIRSDETMTLLDWVSCVRSGSSVIKNWSQGVGRFFLGTGCLVDFYVAANDDDNWSKKSSVGFEQEVLISHRWDGRTGGFHLPIKKTTRKIMRLIVEGDNRFTSKVGWQVGNYCSSLFIGGTNHHHFLGMGERRRKRDKSFL